ncbi:hypothetical protein [Streptomyces sp. NPDC093094]|uniref:hypothetical protein n=1 Tax=Streptomyces sp. NPDC093094 TaxID=3366026 RepID=UPI0037FE7C57
MHEAGNRPADARKDAAVPVPRRRRRAYGLGVLVAATLLGASMPHNAAAATQNTSAEAVRCVQAGNATLNPRFYWRNVFGARLGEGIIHEASSPNPFGGSIAPGSTFTFSWRPETTRNPIGSQYHTHRVNLASIMAVAGVQSVTGPGTLSGTTLSVRETPPQKLAATQVTFLIRPGTEGRTATLSTADHSLTTQWLFASINNIWENTGSISFAVRSRVDLGCEPPAVLS